MALHSPHSPHSPQQFVFPEDDSNSAIDGIVFDDKLHRHRDEIDDLFVYYMREFATPSGPHGLEWSDTVSESQAVSLHHTPFGKAPFDMEIAFNIAKAIFVVHHLCGTPVPVLHALLNPFSLSVCCMLGCANRTDGVRFLCNTCCDKWSLVPSIDDSVRLYKAKLIHSFHAAEANYNGANRRV